jgi:hypothetical protein
MTTTQKFSPETRKALVKALAEILETKATYLGVPSCAYQIGDFYLAKDGALTGPELSGLMTALHERGFEPESSPAAPAAVEAPDVVSAAAGPIAEPAAEPPVLLAPEPGALAKPEIEALAEPEADQVVIEVPLDGFMPEVIDRLCKLIESKEPLLKMALGVDALPVQVLEDRIAFPWFRAAAGGEHINAYAQLAAALCRTAREKTRVNAKPQESYPNPKFSLRVFLLGLGLIGDEYKFLRKILLGAVPGNSAWPSGCDPRKAAQATADAAAAENPCE